MGCTLPICGVALGRVCAYSLRSRFVSLHVGIWSAKVGQRRVDKLSERYFMQPHAKFTVYCKFSNTIDHRVLKISYEKSRSPSKINRACWQQVAGLVLCDLQHINISKLWSSINAKKKMQNGLLHLLPRTLIKAIMQDYLGYSFVYTLTQKFVCPQFRYTCTHPREIRVKPAVGDQRRPPCGREI